MVTDTTAFRAALPEPRLPYLLDELYRRQCQLQRMIRWGDKTPLYVRYIPQLLAIFPQAQFIHIIRDGRDATLSSRAKWGATYRYMDVYYLLRNWQRNVNAGHAARHTMPEAQYMSIRYEELVAEPQALLSQVCNFLGESFEPAMLKHTQLARQVGGGIDGHVEVQAAVHKLSVNRWQREMTPFEKRLADALVGDMLLEMGYRLANVGHLSFTEHLRAMTLGAKFLLTDSTRSLLYQMGILTLNRNRRLAR
jgi:hypothetical protein